MNLVASMITRNELGRYLEPCVQSLLSFCDEIRVLDDASTDGTAECLAALERVSVIVNVEPSFYQHEGRARQALLEWTLEAEPSHVITVDADELVADGGKLRDCLDDEGSVWRLPLEEVWEADEAGVRVRVDGGWSVGSTVVWRVPEGDLRILDRQLACGREPVQVRQNRGRVTVAPTSLLHFGWAREAERQRRYDRYAEHDGGKFHASKHLESILWGPGRVTLVDRAWPAGLAGQKDMILDYASRQ